MLPSGPVYPLFATQAVSLTAVEVVTPTVPEFSGQSVHPACVSFNVSAKHAVGVPPLAPVCPAFPPQSMPAVEPAELLLLARHEPEQAVDVLVPVVVA